MRLHPVLEGILEHKRAEVDALRRVIPREALAEAAKDRGSTRSLKAALTANAPEVKIIAEVKRSSPTESFRPGSFDPVAIARSYEAAGAVAISTLTDARFFSGHQAYVPLIRRAVALPVLRKDFIIDPWQVAESAALGADAMLLMAVNFADTAPFAALYDYALELGVEALVEIHSEREWERVKPLNPEIVGVNNRDFHSPDLSVDLKTTERLAPLLGDTAVVISESGVAAREDITRLGTFGVDGFLIGSAFMRRENPGEALKQLLQGS